MRLWITVTLLIGSTVLLHASGHGEPVVLTEDLRGLPYNFGDHAWVGQEHPLDRHVLQSVAVTDYTNRVYSNDSGRPVQLYIGYYASQRTGDTVHSPKNCLPGSGWDPIRSGYATIPLANGHSVDVNEYVIQRDQDKELVFYWYQGRGRVIASEYDGKFWMVVDAISRNRTDGSLVRIITPIDGDEAKARARLVSFAQDLFPHLEKLLPN
ncbi:MAG: exosortase C-terminal domain/associated protein EpsI [Candidatus Acidiferrales bacterium]